MKDNSTLKSLNRKLEVEFKESQLLMSRLEQILFERKDIESLIVREINLLSQELALANENRKNLFLTGVLKAEDFREEQIKSQLITLQQKLLVAKSERIVAEKRIEQAKHELELLYKEKEGFLKIEDEREVQNERIRVESSDTD